MSQVNTSRNIPTSVCTFSILVDGNNTSGHFKVLNIVVQKELNTISKSTILLQDGSVAERGFEASNSEELVPGKKIEITAGYRNEEESIFEGIIIKHSIRIRNNVSVLEVECRHQAIKMTTKLNNNYFHSLTDVDVAEQLCSDNGLSFEGDSSELTHKDLVQYNCTDWDFMLCRAEGTGFWVTTEEASKISFKKPDFAQEPVLSLAYGSTIKELDAEIDPRIQYEVIKTISWDPGEQQTIDSEAGDPGVPAAGNIPATDLAGVTANDRLEFSHPGLEEIELQLWANSIMKKHRLAKIRGKLKIDGNHLPRPGTLCELQDVGERFEGKVMISGVRHHIEKGIWETYIQFGESPQRFAEKFELEQPLASGLLPAVHGLQIGVVNSFEDPEGAERIQVRLPLVHRSDEGAWMRLSSLDAGSGRGWTFRPEIGDEVITGFLNDDPRYGIILGSLHSSKNPAPYEVSTHNNQKGYFSREQLELVFDDDKKTITIQTEGGQKFVLDEKESSILLEDKNANKIKMSSSGIEISSNSDIKINAGASLKMEGSAAAELSSSASTTVKGGIVQIN